MSLLEHAVRELRLQGMLLRNPDLAAAVLALIGTAAGVTAAGEVAPPELAETVAKLLRGEVLSPLTDDPEEWDDRSELMGEPLWQSRRDPTAFSPDGGVSYFWLEDRKRWSPSAPPIHYSLPVSQMWPRMV